MTGNTPHDHLEKLAHHSYYGELWDKAVIYLGKAGVKALGRSANREAVVYLEKALDALLRLPQSQVTLRNAIDLQLDLRNALFLTGDFGRIRNCLSEAQKSAETLNDLHRLRRVLNAQLSYYSLVGEPERVIEVGERALSPAMACADPTMDLVTNFYLGINHHVMGNHQEAMGVIKRVILAIGQGERQYERFGTSTVVAVSSRYWLAKSLAQTGSFGEGVAVANEGMQIAEEANHPYSKAYVICSLGFLFLLKGELKGAIEALEQSMKICQESEIRALFPLFASYLGFAYALSGRQDQALRLLGEADSEAVSIGRLAERSLRVAWHGESHLLFGRIEKASELALAAVELSEKHTERGNRAWALRLSGLLAARRDPPDCDEAERKYREALVLASELGMKPLEGHCHLGLGQLYVESANPALARMELAKAIEIYRSTEMGFWLAQAESSWNSLKGGV